MYRLINILFNFGYV
ncbi:hypothetical protein F383_38066 [Gossypium arboreum]|uniref:Uncharacterized protein n=1 Tax=Gossypium arboreum TaxID=29729 RepID=A0A0B0M9P7_GOSAR|nr:hypothetical protein F383_38066 [Gossypium arboreum]